MTELLAKELGVHKSDVRLQSGVTSRQTDAVDGDPKRLGERLRHLVTRPRAEVRTMPAETIDGKVIAAALRRGLRQRSRAAGTRDHGVTPGLAVVLVGSDPASRKLSVRSKGKQTRAGMASSSTCCRQACRRPTCLR